MSNPSDYYFAMEEVEEGVYFFSIVTKVFWDENEGLSCETDEELEEVLPGGFFEAMESVYEFDGDPLTGLSALLAAGFIQKQDIIELDS